MILPTTGLAELVDHTRGQLLLSLSDFFMLLPSRKVMQSTAIAAVLFDVLRVSWVTTRRKCIRSSRACTSYITICLQCIRLRLVIFPPLRPHFTLAEALASLEFPWPNFSATTSQIFSTFHPCHSIPPLRVINFKRCSIYVRLTYAEFIVRVQATQELDSETCR